MPVNKGSPNPDLQKVQRFVEIDGDHVVQIEYKDSGAVTADGTQIWRLVTSSENIATIVDGEKVVAAAITPEALHADQGVANSVVVQAKDGNAGWVKLGNATDQHLKLESGDSVRVFTNNLNLVFAEVEINGDGVNYFGG